MAKTAASRRRRTARRGRPAATSDGRPTGGGVEPIRTWGLDPSWFAFRGGDPRGMVVQLAAVTGLAIGLFAAIGRFGSTAIGGSEQLTQLAWLGSILGLVAVPIAAAAGTDAVVAGLARRGATSAATAGRAALLLPPVAALLGGVVLPPLLFAVGGQTLYLGVAFVVLAVVVAVAVAGYVRRRAGPQQPRGPEGGRRS